MAKEALKEEEIEVEIEEAPEPEELDTSEEVDTSEELEVPEGGIGDFVMEDDELDEVYAEKAEDYGNEGIAQFPALAERMAKYGRNEDNMLAHVAEGELIIPRQFIEDEVMKQRIYEVLEEAGVEDPEAYVVGAEANDINPTTGLPEFFLKKLFKKIGRGLKKIVKKVVKVVKKVAPIVLPIALAFTPLGAVYGAALGSGIGTLINGGNLKDALKSALISGAIGGVTSGFTGPGSFGENVAASFADPAARFSQAASGLTGPDKFFTKYTPTGTSGPSVDAVTPDAVTPDAVTSQTAAEQAALDAVNVDQARSFAEQAALDTVNVDQAAREAAIDATRGAGTTVTDPFVPTNPATTASRVTDPVLDQPFAAERAAAREVARDAGQGAANVTGSDGSAFETTMDYLKRGGRSKTEIASRKMAAAKKYLAETPRHLQTEAGYQAAIKSAGPGYLARFGPTAAIGALGFGAMGGFEQPEVEQANFIEYERDTGRPTTGSDLIDRNPESYLISDIGHSVLDPETGKYVRKSTLYNPTQTAAGRELEELQRQFGGVTDRSVLPPLESMALPTLDRAEGGPIFPRRTGGIEPTEGVSGEDSVPAMLMPGEFVMTTEAVRGAGRGNLDNGIQNMYSIMRNLESRGRANA